MSDTRLARALSSIRAATPEIVDIAIILGSGLGGFAERVDGVALPYAEIDGFPVSTAPTHAGVLHIGRLQGKSVAVFQGRLHLYEGHSPQDAAFPVDVANALGAKTILLTNVSGSLNPDFRTGEIVGIEDHIYFPGLTGQGVLVGRRDPDCSPFVNLTRTYDRALLDLADGSPEGRLRRGVYACLAGPHFETPAEGRMIRNMGADMVGMSTVHEAIMARYLDMKVLALSLIVNPVVTDSDSQDVVNESDIWKTIEAATPRFANLLDHILTAHPAAY